MTKCIVGHSFNRGGEGGGGSGGVSESAPTPIQAEALAVTAPFERPNFWWGVFRFGKTKPAIARPKGGWECWCPFHRLNAERGCSKFLTLLEPTVAGEEHVIRRLKVWALECVKYDRQWKHLRYGEHRRLPAVDGDICGLLLEARRIDEGPRFIVLPDARLDEMEAGDSGEATQAAADAVPALQPIMDHAADCVQVVGGSSSGSGAARSPQLTMNRTAAVAIEVEGDEDSSSSSSSSSSSVSD